MDKRNTNKVCSSKYNGERANFFDDRDNILIKLKALCIELEKKKRTVSSDMLAARFPKHFPSDIRSLLCLPEFILTHRGWRVAMLGRIMVYLPSNTGFVVVEKDYLHTPVPSYSRKGDYKVRQYSITNRKTVGASFFIWHSEIKDQIDV